MSQRIEGAWFHRAPASAAALTAVALGLGLWGVAGSPLFAVNDIRVEGIVALSEEEVERLSGVEPGENVLRLSVEDVVRSLRADPRVATAQVNRSLPSTLTIRIVERRPAGWLSDPLGQVVVAVDGTVIERPATRPTDVPRIGLSASAQAIGDRLTGPYPSLRVAASLAPRILRDVASVRYEAGQIAMSLRTGEEVRYGRPSDLGAKNAALARMLEWARQQGVMARYLDVRVPGAPTLLPSRG